MAPGTPRNKKCSYHRCDSKIDDVAKAISCGICQGWFHLSCVSLEQETAAIIKVDKSKNIIWKCDACNFQQPLSNKVSTLEKFVSSKFDEIMSKFANLSSQINNEREKSNLSQPKVSTKSVSSQTIDAADQSPNQADSNEIDTNTNPNDNKAPAIICSYYRKGKCRYGATGKKLIDGQECKFLHPRKCLKFCRNGSNTERGGCAGPCTLLHPILCKSSQLNRTCFSNLCTLAHLSGTRRSRDVEFSMPNNSINYQTNFQRPINSSMNPAYTPYQVNTNSRPVNHPASFSNISRQQVPDYNPNSSGLPATAYQSDYYSANQVSSILKQIQGSFDAILQKSSLNNNNQQPQNVNFPSDYKENNNITFSNSNFSNMPHPTGSTILPNFAKNSQTIPTNLQSL